MQDTIDVLTLSNESLVILEYSCMIVGVRLSEILMYGKMMLLGQFKFLKTFLFLPVYAFLLQPSSIKILTTIGNVLALFGLV